ncbi:MAG: hypothetical protein GY788_10575 [bacterium]|nr:hypothetical protein [bacterium]
MSGFGGIWLTVLSDAIGAGRSALRDLDIKEVPSALVRVASSQGGRLPPPLASRLLGEIDKNEWFRDKVVEEFDGEPGSPSDLFLNRADGWWIELGEVVVAKGAGEEERRFGKLESQLLEVEAKSDVAIKKAADCKRALAEAERQSKRAAESARKKVEDRFAASVADVTDVRNELAEAQSQLAELDSEHRQLQDAFDVLRSRLLKARRERFEEHGPQGESSFVPRDPVKLARLLDLQAAALGRDAGVVPVVAPVEVGELTMASGVRPDSSDAIRWLVGLPEGVVVLVDGYNAQFHIDDKDFTSGGARRRLVDALKRLRTASVRKHRIVVIYDSTLPGERIARTSLGGVEVRFADKDRIADEEIVEMTSELSRVVVISSDRAVRDGAEANGAVVLWSESLAAWLERS